MHRWSAGEPPALHGQVCRTFSPQNVQPLAALAHMVYSRGRGVNRKSAVFPAKLTNNYRYPNRNANRQRWHGHCQTQDGWSRIDRT